MRLILRKLPVTAFTAVAIFDAVKYIFFLVFVKKLMCCVDVLVKQLIYYRVRKMVHFEISKEVEKDEKDILLSCNKRRTKKKL